MINKEIITNNKTIQLIHSVVTNLPEYDTSLDKNNQNEYELIIKKDRQLQGRLIISLNSRLTYISNNPENNKIINLISNNSNLELLVSFQITNHDTNIYHWCSKEQSNDDMIQLLTLEMMARLSITNFYNKKILKKIGFPIF